ncbi:mucin-6 [Urocitellus parryii]
MDSSILGLLVSAKDVPAGRSQRLREESATATAQLPTPGRMAPEPAAGLQDNSQPINCCVCNTYSVLWKTLPCLASPLAFEQEGPGEDPSPALILAFNLTIALTFCGTGTCRYLPRLQMLSQKPTLPSTVAITAECGARVAQQGQGHHPYIKHVGLALRRSAGSGRTAGSPAEVPGQQFLSSGDTMLGLWLLLLLPHGGALLSTDPTTGNTTDPNAEGSLQSTLEKGWCSSWGAGHFSTFDHHAYDFLGTCNYIFAASCQGASPTFSIQLRRGADGNISRIIVELGSSVVTVNETTISIKDIGVVSLPYTSQGLQITPYGQSVQLVAKQVELELVVMWGPDAHLMVLVERKYMGQMCGLCGNFDGKTDNEFLSEDGTLLEPYKYAALQKLDDPNEICTFEAIPRPPVLQATHVGNCTQLLTLVSPECDVPKKPLVLSCQVDMATCAQPGQQNCSCATLSEYSRRCSMAHRPVSNWRGPGLCSVGQCPANQVYQECGTACIRTCSNPQHSCSSPCTFGCFCPKGMVLNDLSNNHTCVPVSQCPCLLNGVVYSPGEVVRAACQSCQCTMGHWTCTGQPCPGHCSLEGGSFVTTFDARPYRFHGTCTYILLQSPQLPNEGTLMAVYDKSGYSHSETSLVAIVYLSGQDKIVISEDEVTNNGDAKWLPYQTRNITIFRQTSTHLQMATTFGLEIVVQRQPVFQVYITLGPQFRGQTRGLCGNFNGNTTDEFTSSAGIDEGTAALFVDSWRAGNCPAALEREIDPCSMSQLNKMYAETHCSVLLKKDGVFEKCHAVLDPKPFYKRCVYQACNYEETFPHICAALGAYVRACSSQAVLLGDWRDSVDNCTIPCTGNRTFSQQSQACDHTCLSLSNREVECHPSAVPVDGCNCPDGTYLDHRNECVRKAQCPCLLESHKFILAGQSTMVNGIICHCINGRLSCPGQSQVFLASCPAPKSFQSCSQSSEDKFGAACAPTCQMLATGITCVPTKCEPGCVCPEGFYEDTSGQCVLPGQCPCDFAGVSYPGGAVLRTDCKNCTCSQGKWTCQQSAHCPSTCILYGEGHIITFDGQRFVFNGNCKYTLATDDCGANSQPSFKILVENVVCGKSGATCSRAIQILLGGLTITMADRNYSISGENSQVHVLVKPSSLNLVLDVDIPNRLNMTLVWNKHMSVSIRVHRASQDALCGLCGNCNGNMKDDFETRSKYVASNELEFVNSWKESPLCSDASYAEDPCSLNPFRRPWAERKCSIIHSQTFTACHSKVYRMPYYEACVRDACLCDKGGDCECLCDAVAAYAKACLDKGVCVDWRAPDFCPIYCDFYNTHSQVGDGKFQYTQEANCTWHYQPCLCPGRLDSFPDTNVEGCYNCSQDEYFDHRTGTCVPCNHVLTQLQLRAEPPGLTGHTEVNSHRTDSDGSHNTGHSSSREPRHKVHSSVHSQNHRGPTKLKTRNASQPRNIRPDHQRISNSTRSPDLTYLSGFPIVHPFSHTNSSEPQQPIQTRDLPLQNTILFPIPTGPWTSLTSESTSPLATTKTKTESPVVLTSLGTQSSPPIPGNLDSSHTMDTFATARPSVTLTGTSLKTTKSRYVKSTSPFATTITKTRKPMPLNSWDLHTTQQIPLTPEPSYSDSASTMANALNGLTRTLPYNTSLLTLPTDAQTSPTALLSTLYSPSRGPHKNDPPDHQQVPDASYSRYLTYDSDFHTYTNLTDLSVFKHRVCLQHCPPFRSPPRNIRPDHQRISNSTRSPDLTYLSGFPIVHPFSHTNSSEPQQPIQPRSALEHLHPKGHWFQSYNHNRPAHRTHSHSTTDDHIYQGLHTGPQIDQHYTNLTDLSVFKHRVCLQHCPPFRSPPRNIRPDHQRISNSTRSPDLTYLSGFPIVHPFSHTNSSEPQQPIQPRSALEHLHPKGHWFQSYNHNRPAHRTHSHSTTDDHIYQGLHTGPQIDQNIRPDHQRISNSTRSPDLTYLSGFPIVHPFSHTNSSEPQQPIQPRSALEHLHPKGHWFQSYNHNHPAHRTHSHSTTDDHIYQGLHTGPQIDQHVNGLQSFNHNTQGLWTHKHCTTGNHICQGHYTSQPLRRHFQNLHCTPLLPINHYLLEKHFTSCHLHQANHERDGTHLRDPSQHSTNPIDLSLLVHHLCLHHGPPFHPPHGNVPPDQQHISNSYCAPDLTYVSAFHTLH